MSHRTILGLKLATASVCFLVLTILSAFGIRAMTGYGNGGDIVGVGGDGSRAPASSDRRKSGVIFEHRGALSASELGLLGSSPQLRGRKVKVDLQLLTLNPDQGPRTISLNLFPDEIVQVELQAPSIYSVNSGILVGQVQGDSESSVRLLIQDGVMDGTIMTHGREFRIIDGGNGLHIVTESSKSSR